MVWGETVVRIALLTENGLSVSYQRVRQRRLPGGLIYFGEVVVNSSPCG